MIAWFSALCLSLSPFFGGEARVTLVRVELVGPLEHVLFDAGAAGKTTLWARLRAGERRTVDVPLPLVMPFGTDGQPIPSTGITVEGAGRAAILGWGAGDPLSDQPVGLLRRPRPPAPDTGAFPIGAPLALGLALALLAGLGERRTLRIGCAVASVALGLWVAGLEPEEHARLVWEVDLGAGTGYSAEATGAVARWSGIARLEVEPADALLALEDDHLGALAVTTARGANSPVRCVLLRPLDIGTNGSTPERLGADLEAVWIRGSLGAWRFHGAWKRGQEEPLPHESDLLPPGWLLDGLPVGVELLVGRMADGAWVRVSGS